MVFGELINRPLEVNTKLLDLFYPPENANKANIIYSKLSQ